MNANDSCPYYKKLNETIPYLKIYQVSQDLYAPAWKIVIAKSRTIFLQ
jgi:hypothetical protein